MKYFAMEKQEQFFLVFFQSEINNDKYGYLRSGARGRASGIDGGNGNDAVGIAGSSASFVGGSVASFFILLLLQMDAIGAIISSPWIMSAVYFVCARFFCFRSRSTILYATLLKINRFTMCGHVLALRIHDYFIFA